VNVLIFGASGSAGGSVLRVCLDAAEVEDVCVIVRRSLAVSHAKLRSIIHADFADYSTIPDVFVGVDAVFYCLGISVRQVSGEAEYRRITYDFAVAAARMLRAQNPHAAFHFISGRGTDLQSRFMWARVKAETEQEVMKIAGAVCWRPAAIDGVPSASEPRLYKVLRPIYPLFAPLRDVYVKGEDIGRAMLYATRERWRNRIVENREIRDLAERRPDLAVSAFPDGGEHRHGN
jgi:uncharacterized protein YbjT (DUF2867 family)